MSALPLHCGLVFCCAVPCCAGLGWALLYHAACHDKYMQDVGVSAGSTVRRYRSFWQRLQRGMSMQHNILRRPQSCCVKLLLIQLLTRRWSQSPCNCFHRSAYKFQMCHQPVQPETLCIVGSCPVWKQPCSFQCASHRTNLQQVLHCIAWLQACPHAAGLLH